MSRSFSAAYIPSGEQKLFSLYHPAEKDRDAREGVLICPPAPFEVRRSQRALRNLAQNLAKAGFHALRFDYRGTSDSSGDHQDWTLDAWRDDIRIAAQHLQKTYDIQRLSVVGLRLGASLAWQALEGMPIKRFVLWDPIFSGDEYLAQLQKTHHILVEREIDRPPFQRPTAKSQILGFAVTEGWKLELSRFQLELPAKARGVIIQSHDAVSGRNIGNFKRVDVEADQQWANPLVLHIQSFAHPCVAAIENALEGRA